MSGSIPNAKSALAADPPKKLELQTDQDRVSYEIGQNIGGQIKGEAFELDLEMIIRGMRDAFAGSPSPQTEEEFKAAFANLQQQALDKAVKESKDFLVKNAKKEGVKTTKSGLQYEVLEAGDGQHPTAKDQVKAHYKGTLLNGKKFDSSYDRDEPSVFALNRVIKGWTEGVQLMSIGSKYRFWIPAELAYGAQARPGIPANSLLVFEIELIDVVSESDEK